MNPTPSNIKKQTVEIFAGATSLTFNALHAISGSANKALVKATFQTREEQKSHKLKVHKPHYTLIKSSAVAAGLGVVDGITGIVSQPVKGIKKEGIKGLFKGVTRGMIGLFLKPAAGVLEAAGKTLLLSTVPLNVPMNRRLTHSLRLVRPLQL